MLTDKVPKPASLPDQRNRLSRAPEPVKFHLRSEYRELGTFRQTRLPSEALK